MKNRETLKPWLEVTLLNPESLTNVKFVTSAAKVKDLHSIWPLNFKIYESFEFVNDGAFIRNREAVLLTETNTFLKKGVCDFCQIRLINQVIKKTGPFENKYKPKDTPYKRTLELMVARNSNLASTIAQGNANIRPNLESTSIIRPWWWPAILVNTILHIFMSK